MRQSTNFKGGREASSGKSLSQEFCTAGMALKSWIITVVSKMSSRLPPAASIIDWTFSSHWAICAANPLTTEIPSPRGSLAEMPDEIGPDESRAAGN